MDDRQLAAFVAVAEELHFTRAAARLFVVQSTLSASIRALEQELGSALFERSTRRVALTAVGEALLPEARRAIDGLDRMRSLAAEDAAGLRGRVRVGAGQLGEELLQPLPVVRQVLRQLPQQRPQRGTEREDAGGEEVGQRDLGVGELAADG